MGREGRDWVFVDCGLWEDPRIIEAGRDGKDLFLAALGYCGANLTDGFVSAKALPVLAVKAMMSLEAAMDAADALVEQKLWTDAKGGWCVTRYMNWQRTRAEAEAERDRLIARRAKGRERIARWREEQAAPTVTSEDASVTRHTGNALQHALPNAIEESREEVSIDAPAAKQRRAPRAITPDARRLAKLLLDRWFEINPNATRIEVSNASKGGIQDLLDLGPPNAKQGVPVERVKEMIELLHTRGREPWPGKGTCWAQQVRSGEKLREKWTDFEGKWMNGQTAGPDRRPAPNGYVRAGLSFAEQSKQGGTT